MWRKSFGGPLAFSNILEHILNSTLFRYVATLPPKKHLPSLVPRPILCSSITSPLREQRVWTNASPKSFWDAGEVM